MEEPQVSVEAQAKRIEVLEFWKFRQWSLHFAVIALCAELRAPCEQVPEAFVWNCDASPFVSQCEYFSIGAPRSANTAPVAISLASRFPAQHPLLDAPYDPLRAPCEQDYCGDGLTCASVAVVVSAQQNTHFPRTAS